MKQIKPHQTVLVVGANGATGRHAVDQLLKRGYHVKALVRNPDHLPNLLTDRDQLTIIKGDINLMSDHELAQIVESSDAIISCLGHNLSWQGIYGKPRRLVVNAVCRLTKAAIARPENRSTKFLLMNSTGCRNKDANEHISFGHKVVLGLIRLLVPPHRDNELAANYLRKAIGRHHDRLEWVVIRPDSLIDEAEVHTYHLHPSPTRSALFNSGQTSRIQVGHFMAELLTNHTLWNQWKGQMPVIYRRE